MKAISLCEPGRFETIEIDPPSPPGPDEAIVAVHRVGICGTDFKAYLGKFPFFEYPRIPGHELGVVVESVGSEVSHLQPGDRCAVEPYLNRPDSFASRCGSPNCCEHLHVIGVHGDGGLCPQIKLPARKLHPSASLSCEQLALVETLTIGCHAVDRAAVREGERVLVIGAGPIGLTVVQFALLAGAEVTVLETNPQRLEFCRNTMAVSHTVCVESGVIPREHLREWTRGELYTVVADCTGSPASMMAAFETVAHTGRYVFVGLSDGQITFHQPLMHARELTLLASRNALPADFQRTIGLIERGAIDTLPWITDRIAFASVADEFESLMDPERQTIKAVVEL